MGFVRAPGAVPFVGAGLFACKARGTVGRECLQIEESLSAVSRLCDRRMLSQRPAGLSMVLRAFLCRGLCLRPGGCSLRGGGPFAWRCAKRGGMLARRAGRQGAGMPASRGVCRRCSLPQYRGFAAGADAPVTPGRSVDGFEGVFVSWALSASRGLFPSRGRAFLRGGARSGAGRWQSGQNGWGQACLRGSARQL